MTFKNKHVVITGAASGIGLALLHQLSNANKISVVCRPSDNLDKLRETYPSIDIYEADLADTNQVETAAEELIKSDQDIDFLINNAAVQYTPKFTDEDFRYDTIHREIAVNFTAICILTYLLMPLLLKDTRSTIVNINSGLGLVPKTSSAVYCATKGALNIFSKSLALQLEDTNVRVQQVFLPLVDTAMTRGRGRGKLSVEKAAADIIKGLEKRANWASGDIDIGKVIALRFINRLSPRLAQRIMKAG